MHNISIQLKETVDLNEREKTIIQVTTLNFAAMTNALITGQSMVINPLEDESIGATLVYPKALDDELLEKMKQSLESRFINFSKMIKIDFEIHIKSY